MTNRRERKKQETRNKIFTTAMKLFQERGFEATTIDMIAEQADVARGTVFLHFPSKEELLAHWGQDRIEELMERRHEWDQEDISCEEQILKMFHIAMVANRKNFSLVKIWVKATISHGRKENIRLRNLFADILEAGQERGLLKEEIDPIIGGNMLENIYLYAVYDWVQNDGDWPIEEIMATKVHYLFNGLNG
jgi:AcrR family transcriptional regulator